MTALFETGQLSQFMQGLIDDLVDMISATGELDEEWAAYVVSLSSSGREV